MGQKCGQHYEGKRSGSSKHSLKQLMATQDANGKTIKDKQTTDKTRQKPNNKKNVKFHFRRLLIIIPMALLVVTLTWGLIRIAPGNFYSTEKKLPPAVEANIKKKYGLDKPWYKQYAIMIGNIVQLDFGDSLKYQGQSVNEIIKRHLPYSATIGILAYILAASWS